MEPCCWRHWTTNRPQVRVGRETAQAFFGQIHMSGERANQELRPRALRPVTSAILAYSKSTTGHLASATGVIITKMKLLSVNILWAVLLAYAPCATAQQAIKGRYYPEKPEYLVGEPIIVDFEVVNHGHKVGEIARSSCDELGPGPFEVDGATRKKEPAPFVCGPKVVAVDCLMGGSEIPAGGKYIKRLFLNGPFALGSPGTYRVRATSEQPIGRSGTKEILADLRVESEFEVKLRAPQGGELRVAYKPFFDDLKSKDVLIRYFAAAAITQNPPVFAEEAIFSLATNRMTATLSAEGLGRLGTPSAREKLIEMASSGSEQVRQPAIQALGELGNSEDCQALLDIGNQNKNYTQGEAYIYAGRICQERAIPALLRLLPNADAPLSGYLAAALANTVSRNAISPLVSLLTNPDEGVRRNAADALATLTHRKSQYGIDTAKSSNDARLEWTHWWESKSSTASIYGPNECADPQPLT